MITIFSGLRPAGLLAAAGMFSVVAIADLSQLLYKRAEDAAMPGG